MIQTVLLGGPLDGRLVNIVEGTPEVVMPQGRYVRRGLSPSVVGYVFDEPTPPKPDRWAKKKRPNPFPPLAR